jgi:hypothetical protein
MKNLSSIIQGYLGMTPKDKGCENWTEMGSKMEEDINDYFNKKSFSIPDIRNKLTPISNLITMMENGLVKGNVEMYDLVLKEIEQCKISIDYLSKKRIYNEKQ